MRKINPRNVKPFATEEEIAQCHPYGAIVNWREYNTLERDWCRPFALLITEQPASPKKVGWYGPVIFANGKFVELHVWSAVFDRR